MDFSRCSFLGMADGVFFHIACNRCSFDECFYWRWCDYERHTSRTSTRQPSQYRCFYFWSFPLFSDFAFHWSLSPLGKRNGLVFSLNPFFAERNCLKVSGVVTFHSIIKKMGHKKMVPSSIIPDCISAYIIRFKDGEPEFLMLHRCSSYLNGTWQMVSGGINIGEKAWEAALREVKEETGFVPDQFYNADIIESFYIAAIDKIFFVPVFVGFVDHPTAVTLSPHEHDDYEWLSFEEAKERLEFHEQKRIITHVYHQFILTPPKLIFKIETTPAGLFL